MRKYWWYKQMMLGVLILILSFFYPVSVTKNGFFIFGTLLIMASYLQLKRLKIGFFIYLSALACGSIILFVQGFNKKNTIEIIGSIICALFVCFLYLHKDTIIKLNQK